MSAAIQTVWAELVVATLVDAGVAACVVSPGSRSTPLVAALSGDARLPVVVMIDERAAAFFALGLARASGQPVALVCTSGTAGAHYLPAVIEAFESGVPLIAITADRPPELQGARASQTIDQVKLFGDHVVDFVDLGPPHGSEHALRAVRRRIAAAVATARGPRPGPVHVQAPLRKPLEPAAPATDDERAAVEAASRARATPLAFAPPPRSIADDEAIAALASELSRARRPLIVGGPATADAATRDAIHAIAEACGAIVLVEACSQLRFGPRPSGVVAIDAFDPIVAARARDLAPDVIVQIGRDPVAACWPHALAMWRDARRWIVADRGWPDPDASAVGVVAGELGSTLRRLVDRIPHTATADARWTAAWIDAGRIADAAIERALCGEAAIVRAAIGAAPRDAAIQLGNSLPVRVVDHVVPGGGAARLVIAQRGAAGIDGNIAAAAGATWTGRAVIAIVGDVAFAHDLGGLAAAVRASKAPLVVVVVDNGGGRIFDGLPVAAVLPADAITTFFHTASGLDPAAVARALGAAGVTATSPTAVAAAVAAAASHAGVTVIHVPVVADGARIVRDAAIAALSPGASS